MAHNVFISFRYKDGHEYKEELSKLFNQDEDTVDFSEDEDRSKMSEETIREYLYRKLARTSVTIVLLTPKAIEHKTKMVNKNGVLGCVYDDWMYDEIRYSLQDRENNRTNGLIAVYTQEAANRLVEKAIHTCSVCNSESSCTTVLNFKNLCRRNMFNVKDKYKLNKCIDLYDSVKDHYCSLVSYEQFKANPGKYVDEAFEKRNRIEQFNICKEMD